MLNQEIIILVVDDDIHYLRIYQRIFSIEGFTVLSTSSSDETLAMFTEWSPHLAILNVHLGKEHLDGFQLCMHLKKINPKVPVILVSGRGEKEFIEKGKVIGAEDYIVKPFVASALVHRVKEILLAAPKNPWAGVLQEKKDFISSSKIGEILVAMGAINEEQLSIALKSQERGVKLGDHLVKSGFISEENLAKVLAVKFRLPYFTDFSGLLENSLVDLIPKKIAYENNIVPVFRTEDTLYIGTTQPLDLFVLDNIKLKAGIKLSIYPIITTKSNLMKTLKDLYGSLEMSSEVAELKKSTESVTESVIVIDEKNTVEAHELAALASQISVEKLTDSIIYTAVKERSSDIHFEPFREGRYKVRFRIDGQLTEIMLVPESIAVKVISKIKVMANIDFAKRHLPQDGGVRLRISGKEIDLRVSSLPGIEGEKVVIRILDKESVIVPVESLGMREEHLKILLGYLYKPQGFIVVTGPTGSGKTTTLYSVINKVATGDKSVVTIEDPVEYRISRFHQVQVNVQRNLTFASALRAVLRQDPNIILIGEIRDRETAEIAINAALTGHLVISTLHTNNTFETIPRLVDIGVEHYLLASALSCIVAQRLVRVLCPHCKKPYHPTKDLLEKLNLDSTTQYTFFGCVGCPKCNNIGYRGRTGIYEILPSSQEVKNFILEKRDSSFIRTQMKKRNMQTLWDDAILKVVNGITSVEEIIKFSPDNEF